MQQRLIIHLGLHKTGTTFYQRAIWPVWRDVSYVGKPRPKDAASLDAVVRGKTDPVLLLSDETLSGSLKGAYLASRSWPDQLEDALQGIKERYSNDYNIRILVSLRRHDAWLLSVYKHYLKYGGVETLESFLGLKRAPATVPAKAMAFVDKLERVEDVLNERPFCFFLEETRVQPGRLSEQLAEFCGVRAGPDFSTHGSFNEGVNQREAALCRFLNRVGVNPGRLGTGALARNATRGFTIAKQLSRIGLLGGDDSPLTVSAAVASHIRQHFTADLDASIAHLCHTRGLCAEQFSEQMQLML